MLCMLQQETQINFSSGRVSASLHRPERDSLRSGSFFSHFGYYIFNVVNLILLFGSLPNLPCMSLFIMSSFL